MNCFHPINVPYLVNGKKTKSFHLVPCGRCPACLEKRQQEWIFRLQQEEKVTNYSYFITLTYEDQNLYYNDFGVASVNKRHIQLFIKRLRKKLPCKLRYYIISEYGPKTFRPHYHGILFSNLPLDSLVTETWQLGFCYLGQVSESSIAYTTKYCLKECEVPNNADPNFMLCSQKPAIGLNYLSEEVVTYHEQEGKNYLTLRNGRKLGLPRYYRNKMGLAPFLPGDSIDDFARNNRDRIIAYEENKKRKVKRKL